MDAWSEVLLRLTEVGLALSPLATSPLIWLSVVERRGEDARTAKYPRLPVLAADRCRMPQCGYLYPAPVLEGQRRGRVSQSLSAGLGRGPSWQSEWGRRTCWAELEAQGVAYVPIDRGGKSLELLG